MKQNRFSRAMMVLASGAILLQGGGCGFGFTEINDVVQTILLGITAAGGLAILQNI